MLLRELVPRGMVGGLFPGISPPSSQLASLALRGGPTRPTTTTYTPNLKHQVRGHYYGTFKHDSRKNPDRRAGLDSVDAPFQTVKCLSVAINHDAWVDYLSGGQKEGHKKKRLNVSNRIQLCSLCSG